MSEEKEFKPEEDYIRRRIEEIENEIWKLEEDLIEAQKKGDENLVNELTDKIFKLKRELEELRKGIIELPEE